MGFQVMIQVSINTGAVSAQLNSLLGRMAQPARGLKIIGEIVRSSIRTNFRQGGRPTKWPTSHRSDGQRRGQTLRDTNRLYNSFTIQANNQQVAVGTNVAYAAVHHFGAKKGSFGQVVAIVKAHTRRGKPVKQHSRRMKLPWGDIPARPFMLVQDEDWADMTQALSQFLVRG